MDNVNEYLISPSCVGGLSDYFLLDTPADLAIESSKAVTISGLLNGELSNYIRSVMAYPISKATWSELNVFILGDTPYYLAAIQTWGSTSYLYKYNVPVYRNKESQQTGATSRYINRIYIGYVDFAPSATDQDWTWQEPYCNVDIWLPYYGYFKLRTADIFDTRMFLYLSVDFATGQATYYITAGNYTDYNSTTSADGGADCTLVATVTFQLGVAVPLGETGLQNATRNALMGAVTTAAGSVGTTEIRYEDRSDRLFNRMQDEHRQNMANMGVDIDSWHRYSSVTVPTLEKPSQVAAFATSLLGFGQVASVNHANNAAVDPLGPRTPFLLRRRANFLTYHQGNFNHIYGKPLHNVKALSDCKTEDGDIPRFIQCSGLTGGQSGMTSPEYLELTSLLQQGVYY